MATPVVTQIRQAVITALKTIEGLTVYDSLSTPWDDEVSLPGASVSVEREDVDRPAYNAQQYTVRVGLQVVLAVMADDAATAAATLDALEEQVLGVMLSQTTWPSDVEAVEWQGVTRQYATEVKAIASSVLRIEVQASMAFEPTYTVPLKTLHVDVDHDRDTKAEVTWEAKP